MMNVWRRPHVSKLGGTDPYSAGGPPRDPYSVPFSARPVPHTRRRRHETEQRPDAPLNGSRITHRTAASCTVNHPLSSPFNSPNTPLPLPQHLLQKLLKAQRHKPIPIIIIALKRIRHPLQRYTRLDKQIKAQTPLPPLIKRPEQESHEPLTQPIPKRHQRVPELIQADVAGAIGVEAVEEGAPGGEEGPEAAELAEFDGAAAGGVEHADHEGDGVGVEGGPVAVYEGGGELGFGEVAAGCFFWDVQSLSTALNSGNKFGSSPVIAGLAGPRCPRASLASLASLPSLPSLRSCGGLCPYVKFPVGWLTGPIDPPPPPPPPPLN
ncbi:hypothetical protein V501_00837, partial [Pseudogymnoascus sp. VKM F-4519 (FW-2642)]